MFKLLLFLILSIFPLLIFFPTSVFAHSEVQVIEMTKEGFEPQSVTVDKNQTIIFYNRDTQPRYPASNPHPTHDLYPEFDPKKPIQPGDSWPFKPKKIGTWKYHDHLFPHMRGVITVKAEEKQPEEIQPKETKKETNFWDSIHENIAKLLSNIQHFFTPKKDIRATYAPPSKESFIALSAEKQTEVIKQIAKEDPKNAWQYLKNVYKNENGASGPAHDLAHLTGNLLYASYGFSGLSFCSQEFAFGCYHGFLDEAFAKNLDHLSDAEQACLKLDKNQEVTGPVASCMHGIGHGVASYYITNDLPASLKTCKKLTKGSHYCFDGVFMEYVRNAPDTFFHNDDPLYPCNQFDNDDDYAVACGRNQPSLLLYRFHKSLDEVATACESSKSQPFKEACFDAIGFSLASSGNVTKIISGCQSIKDPKFMANCMEAAAGEMVFQQMSDGSKKSREVCIALPANKQESCLQYVQGIMKAYYSN